MIGQQVQQQFFAPETPMYFPNNLSVAPVAIVKASHNIAPNNNKLRIRHHPCMIGKYLNVFF